MGPYRFLSTGKFRACISMGVVYLALCVTVTVIGENRLPAESVPANGTDPWDSIVSNETSPPPNYVPKRPGHYSRDDWATVIDETWGPGLPTDEKLDKFYTFWRTIDSVFACFQNLALDWDSVWVTCSTEIVEGVSLGRFAGMLSHASMALRESHTMAFDLITTGTTGQPGVPLLRGNHGYEPWFGAGLSPLPDSSLLVYKVVDYHPLGLVPGDIILGYDNRPWKELFRELIDAQLPLTPGWGSSESSFTHVWLTCAGVNFHLFDTIDIIKHETGDTVHLPTSPIGGWMEIFPTEQMEIPGVAFPADTISVTWGIVEGTQIGYIYAMEWGTQAGILWERAIDSLMNEYETVGLIIDFRHNVGGSIIVPLPGLQLLFNDTVDYLGFSIRCDHDDHNAMCIDTDPEDFWIEGHPDSYYDRPIAMLLGPGSTSAGDMIALAMTHHPETRVFGKPTSAAFNSPLPGHLGSGFYFYFAFANAFAPANPDQMLTRIDIPVDEEVWLTPDVVADGGDDVVEAAIDWIMNDDCDEDGVATAQDNCPVTPNPGQEDFDEDGIGDFCDNCIDNPNADQNDQDGDGVGDECDVCPGYDDKVDSDEDGVPDACDNCKYWDNPDQADFDEDGLGDICDPCPADAANDIDMDEICGDLDNCPTIFNPGQEDDDNDGTGDLCDVCPMDPDNDIDSDGICGDVDLCPDVYDPGQEDTESDSIGDACDNCPDVDNSDQADNDGDNIGDLCDNCPDTANEGQSDSDYDGIGDVCDPFDNCGDANGDNQLNVGDAVFLISYVFKAGPAPEPLEFGDANCDSTVNVADAVYLISYIFKGGPQPCCP
jgi:hypothetical protein